MAVILITYYYSVFSDIIWVVDISQSISEDAHQHSSIEPGGSVRYLLSFTSNLQRTALAVLLWCKFTRRILLFFGALSSRWRHDSERNLAQENASIQIYFHTMLESPPILCCKRCSNLFLLNLRSFFTTQRGFIKLCLGYSIKFL